MNDKGDERLYNNLFVTVVIFYDKAENEKLNHDLLEDQIREVLCKTPYGGYKINSITVECYDKNKGTEKSFAGRISGKTSNIYLNNEVLSVKQPEGEKNIQTLVYHFVKDWNDTVFGTSTDGGYGEIRLRRCGIDGDGGNLQMEILIDSLPPGVEKQPFFDTLEGRGKDLFEHIMADGESVKFLEGHEIGSVNVTFHTPWGSVYEHENEYHEYMYRLTE